MTSRKPAALSPSPASGRGAGERAKPLFHNKSSQILAHAKALRGRQTDAEDALWHQLRAGRFLGLKFKRQKPVGPYIVDFICLAQRLVIELDGGQHANSASDPVRDAFLRAQGYRVLRFWNDAVLLHMDQVLEALTQFVSAPQATADFSPLFSS